MNKLRAKSAFRLGLNSSDAFEEFNLVEDKKYIYVQVHILYKWAVQEEQTVFKKNRSVGIKFISG